MLAVRMAALQFIKPEHLEIAHDFANDAALLLAQKELVKINMHKVCVLPCAVGNLPGKQAENCMDPGACSCGL